MQSAWLYRRVAAVERDARKRKLFESLAEAAADQSLSWQRAAGITAEEVTRFRPSTRARLVGRLLGLLGVRPLKTVLIAMKLRGLSVYGAPVAGGHSMPTSVEQVGVRHRGVGGNNLRAAVFGVNDGLVSNASLIMGVAGAGADSQLVLTTGIAGLLAGALSMAAGEFVSVRSQREMFEYQIGLERDELAEYPDEEAEELALIYAARGMDLARAREVAHELMRDHRGAPRVSPSSRSPRVRSCRWPRSCWVARARARWSPRPRWRAPPCSAWEWRCRCSAAVGRSRAACACWPSAAAQAR